MLRCRKEKHAVSWLLVMLGATWSCKMVVSIFSYFFFICSLGYFCLKKFKGRILPHNSLVIQWCHSYWEQEGFIVLIALPLLQY